MAGEEVISHDRLRTTDYYNDFARRYDGVRLLAGVVLREGPVFANLSLLRGEAGDPFGPGEKQSLTALMPHLQRAKAIHRRIDALTSLNAAATEAFDRVPLDVVLLDESGRVLFSNGEARILNEADAIRFGNGRLRATLAAEDAMLQRLIHDVTIRSRRVPTAVGAGAVITRRCGKSPVQVLVAPLRGTAPFAESQRVAVFLTDPTKRFVPASEVLRACFGFSPAETRVARELLDGRSANEISTQLLRTENTVRGYLKTILAKTGDGRSRRSLRSCCAALRRFGPRRARDDSQAHDIPAGRKLYFVITPKSG